MESGRYDLPIMHLANCSESLTQSDDFVCERKDSNPWIAVDGSKYLVHGNSSVPIGNDPQGLGKNDGWKPKFALRIR